MQTKVRLDIQIRLEEEIRTEMWDKERAALKKQLAEEMLPGLKEQARNRSIRSSVSNQQQRSEYKYVQNYVLRTGINLSA